jgi:hypothetical protein
MSLKLSRGKVNLITQLIIDFIETDEDLDYQCELSQLRLSLFHKIMDELRNFEEIETEAKEKIESIKKNIPEGSQEWQILFRKYCREAIEKFPRSWN